jgi:ribosome assembly protein YihI (activator of Der GTPase)
MRRSLTLALVLVTLAPVFASAQTMAELAARERERKKNQKPTKVITEDDLRRGSAGRGTVNTGANEPAVVASPASAPTAGAAPGTEKPKTEEELRAEAEKAWRDKLTKAQAEVQRVSQALEATNRNLGDVTGNLYGAQRTNLLAQAEKLKLEHQQALQQVEMLQEEGRRSRYRP